MSESAEGAAGARAWQYDVDVGERALTTTGGKTWGAARRLADFLESDWPNIVRLLELKGSGGPAGDVSERGSACRVLELGAGTGWLGMTFARNVAPDWPAASVCLTEQASGGAMEWLEDNLASSRAAGLPLGAVWPASLDWRLWAEASERPSQLVSGSAPGLDDGDAAGTESSLDPGGLEWDVVLGSDLIYDMEGVRLLPRVFAHFLRTRPSAVALYAHTLHRYDDFDLQFFEEIREQGLSYHAVAAEGAETSEEAGADADPLASSGEGFLEELFPEKRVVVFQIRPSGGSGDASRPWLPWSRSLARAGER